MRSGFKLNFILLSALFVLIFSGCGKADPSLGSEVEETSADAAVSVSDPDASSVSADTSAEDEAAEQLLTEKKKEESFITVSNCTCIVSGKSKNNVEISYSQINLPESMKRRYPDLTASVSDLNAEVMRDVAELYYAPHDATYMDGEE